MAVDVLIKSGGLFKKNINIKDIIFDDMRYGIMDDNYRLVENEIGKYTVVFYKEHLCRGYEVSVIDNTINLRMTLPTSDIDIDFFYDYIKRIMKRLKVKKFVRNDIVETIENIDLFKEEDKALSLDTLQIMLDDINSGKYREMYLFGVMNPIVVTNLELVDINNDIKKFGEFMHNKQKLDIYYAKAGIYKRNDGSLFGVYVLTENVKSVFPYEPGEFILNDDIVMDDWNISFVVDSKILGVISYSDFLREVKKDINYDSKHFIIELDSKKIEKLINKYKKDL